MERRSAIINPHWDRSKPENPTTTTRYRKMCISRPVGWLVFIMGVATLKDRIVFIVHRCSKKHCKKWTAQVPFGLDFTT